MQGVICGEREYASVNGDDDALAHAKGRGGLVPNIHKEKRWGCSIATAKLNLGCGKMSQTIFCSAWSEFNTNDIVSHW